MASKKQLRRQFGDTLMSMVDTYKNPFTGQLPHEYQTGELTMGNKSYTEWVNTFSPEEQLSYILGDYQPQINPLSQDEWLKKNVPLGQRELYRRFPHLAKNLGYDEYVESFTPEVAPKSYEEMGIDPAQLFARQSDFKSSRDVADYKKAALKQARSTFGADSPEYAQFERQMGRYQDIYGQLGSGKSLWTNFRDNMKRPAAFALAAYGLNSLGTALTAGGAAAGSGAAATSGAVATPLAEAATITGTPLSGAATTGAAFGANGLPAVTMPTMSTNFLGTGMTAAQAIEAGIVTEGMINTGALADFGGALPSGVDAFGNMTKGNILDDDAFDMQPFNSTPTSGGSGVSSFWDKLKGYAEPIAGLVDAYTNYQGGKDAREDYEKAFKAANPFAPYREQYAKRLNTLMDDPSSIEQDPGYKWALEQGTKSLNRKQAAAGNRFSGRALAEAQQYGQSLADQYRNQEVERLSMLSGAGWTPSGLAYGAGASNQYWDGIRGGMYDIGAAFGYGKD